VIKDISLKTENDYGEQECSMEDQTVLEIDFLTVLLCPMQPEIKI